MTVQDDRVGEFHRLHASGCFVMPNPWDLGGAHALEQLGIPGAGNHQRGVRVDGGTYGQRRHARPGSRAPAIGRGWGGRSGERGLQGRLRHRPRRRVRESRACRDHRHSRVVHRRLHRRSGASPASARPGRRAGLRGSARDRRQRQPGGPAGRSEGFVVGRPDLEETIRRLQAYAEAGADCLYAPRIGAVEQVPPSSAR